MISFNPTNAKQTVITAIALTAIVTVIRDVAEHTMPDVPKLLIGAFLAAILLTLLADVIPELAAALAILVLVSTLLQNGAPALQAVTARVAPPKSGTVTA